MPRMKRPRVKSKTEIERREIENQRTHIERQERR